MGYRVITSFSSVQHSGSPRGNMKQRPATHEMMYSLRPADTCLCPTYRYPSPNRPPLRKQKQRCQTPKVRQPDTPRIRRKTKSNPDAPMPYLYAVNASRSENTSARQRTPSEHYQNIRAKCP